LLFLTGLCLLVAGAAVAPSVAGARTLPSHLTARFDWSAPSHVSTSAALRQAAAATTIQMWSRNQLSGGTLYPYTMVGRNPFVAEKYPSTTIKTYVVLLKIENPGGDTFDPTAADSCDAGDQSAEARVLDSPILKNKAYTWGGTPISPVGTQITDAFQRAEFWKYTNPSGVNPLYHVKLGFDPTTQLITLTVPLVSNQPELTGGCDPLLALNIASWDSRVQGPMFQKLEQTYGINPTDFVLFVTKNTVFYQGSVGNCCILGYHHAFATGGGTGPVQTYAIADYDTTGNFLSAPDISPLSHEVAEWMNDPLTTNPTPAWGHTGQVSGCQSTLEVGDPLAGTTFPVPLFGFTYHPQELAFFSWFYSQKPSIAVNGWYSDQGTFTTPAAPCS
jgi:hypothetical protein